MTSRHYDTLDEKVSVRIQALHKAHPKLGHHGILEALKQESIHLDPEDLRNYMADHHIKPERDWRPWKWRGAPTWMGGPPNGE